MQVSAIIHLFHKKGRTTNSRYGQFIRPDKSPHPEAQDLHLWLGRELSIEEFNEQLPKAIRSVMTTDPVSCKILVRPGADEAGSAEAIEALKKEHAEALEAVQAGVNTFTEEVNAQIAAANEELASKAARIAELEDEHEAALAAARADIATKDTHILALQTALDALQLASDATKPVVVPPDVIVDEVNPSPESLESSPTPVVEAAPVVAGEQPQDAAPQTTTPVPEVKAADKSVRAPVQKPGKAKK